MPDVPVTCGDYTRVLPIHCTRGCGCTAHPAFPAPSDFFGPNDLQNFGRLAPRECEVLSINVIARSSCDEAIHSSCGEMDCFVASLLAMTVLRAELNRIGCLKIESKLAGRNSAAHSATFCALVGAIRSAIAPYGPVPRDMTLPASRPVNHHAASS
jgi:hypothetical protein